MRLTHTARSSSAYRVRIALALKRIEYESILIDPSETSSKSKSPLKQVPCLELGNDFVLSQSVAIVELLDELYPNVSPLYPKDPYMRAKVREAVEIINSGTQPLQNTPILEEMATLGGEEARVRWAHKVISKGLRGLDDALMAPDTRCFGNTLTAADVYLVPQMINALRYGVDVKRDFPRLYRVYNALQELPEFSLTSPTAML